MVLLYKDQGGWGLSNSTSNDIVNIWDQPHMVESNEKYHVLNSSAMTRLVERNCFLGRVLKLQNQLEVPNAFKVMGAYSFLASLCGSHSHVHGGGKYPLNLWVLLVGPSSGRKSSAIIPYQNVMQEYEILRELILPENATSAAYRKPLEEIYDHYHTTLSYGDKAKSAGMIFAQEFGDFFKSDNKDDFSSFFTRLWGDQRSITYSRVSINEGEVNEIIKPCVSMLGAIQTLRLLDVVPMRTWHQGFFPRMIVCYSDQSWPEVGIESNDWNEGDEFSDLDDNSQDYGSLLLPMEDDIIKLSNSCFECGFSSEAAEMFNDTKLPALPKQLVEYKNRRSEHLRKLSALTAISRAWYDSFNSEISANKKVRIEKEDFEIARLLLTWNDSQLMSFSRDVAIPKNKEIYDRLDSLFQEYDGVLTEKQLAKFISNEVPAFYSNSQFKKNLLENYIDFKDKIYTRKLEEIE